MADGAGIENVRGGPWPMVELDATLTRDVQRHLSAASDCCFFCGSAGHFAVDCPQKAQAASPKPHARASDGATGSSPQPLSRPPLPPSARCGSPHPQSKQQASPARADLSSAKPGAPCPSLDRATDGWVGPAARGRPPLSPCRSTWPPPCPRTPPVSGRSLPCPSPATRAALVLDAPGSPTRKRPKGQQACTRLLPRSLAPQFNATSPSAAPAAAPVPHPQQRTCPLPPGSPGSPLLLCPPGPPLTPFHVRPCAALLPSASPTNSASIHHLQAPHTGPGSCAEPPKAGRHRSPALHHPHPAPSHPQPAGLLLLPRACTTQGHVPSLPAPALACPALHTPSTTHASSKQPGDAAAAPNHPGLPMYSTRAACALDACCARDGAPLCSLGTSAVLTGTMLAGALPASLALAAPCLACPGSAAGSQSSQEAAEVAAVEQLEAELLGVDQYDNA